MRATPWDKYPYHPTAEQIVSILRQQTQNTRSDSYYRVITTYFLSQLAASMRCYIKTKDRGKIPVNTYVCALMESGSGKGHSLNIMEDKIVHKFKDRFREHTFNYIADIAIEAEALKKANRNGSDFQDELDKLTKEFHGYGAMPYSFSEGTSPAYKQIRTKAQIAGIGSMNFIMDEVGSNLLSAQELLTVSLETYDVGKVKEKITKSSTDNVRQEQRNEPVPSNMLVFGTPAKVFNGGKEESEFMSLLETGYARRFLFGFGNKGTDQKYSAEELYDLLSNSVSDSALVKLATKFGNLSDPVNHNLIIDVGREVGIALLQYKLDCEEEADTYPDHDHIRKAEMQHRYFKVLKVAGAYSFVDSELQMSLANLYAAMKVIEDSGEAFNIIMSRPKNYERLAKYIVQNGSELTHADLDADLVFYKGSQANKNDMLHMATAWGYSNNIIIKRRISDGIEFISGESLKENDLSQMILSYSVHVADNYVPATPKWTQLHKLTQKTGLHWCNHTFIDKHRSETNAQIGFNMVVLDCDGGISLANARDLLDEYTAHYYTTKRSTPNQNRFRIVIPLKYNLKLTSKDFKEFMDNMFNWLPFDVDTTTGQRCKKWLSHSGSYYYTEGELLDPTKFIPRTSKTEEYTKQLKGIGSASALERWFLLNELVDGNRNNGLLKYAMIQFDTGATYDEAEDAVKALNAKLGDGKLTYKELSDTVLNTLNNKYCGV